MAKVARVAVALYVAGCVLPGVIGGTWAAWSTPEGAQAWAIIRHWFGG